MTTTSWHPLIRTTADQADVILQRALDQLPRLTYYGIGIANPELKRPDQVQLELQEQRAALQASLDQIAACVDWIKLQPPRPDFSAQTSYGRKHNVEAWFRIRGAASMFIGNGAFIAAAVGLGVPGKPQGTGPNMIFKLMDGPLDVAQWEAERVRTGRDRYWYTLDSDGAGAR